MHIEPPATIDLAQVAARLGLSLNSIYVAARKQQIPGVCRIGGRYLVRRAIFERWLEGRELAVADLGKVETR